MPFISYLKFKSDRRSSCGLLSTLDSVGRMVTVMNVRAYYINNQIDLKKHVGTIWLQMAQM